MSKPLTQEYPPKNHEGVDEVLWIGDGFPTEQRQFQIGAQSIEVKNLPWAGSYNEFLRRPFRLVIGEISNKGQLEILENLRLPKAETWLGVCFSAKAPKDLVRRALNSSQIKFFIDSDFAKIQESLAQPLREQNLESQRSWLLREYYQRNKNLESLTSDLEKIVLERTVHLEQSNKAQTEKVQMER